LILGGGATQRERNPKKLNFSSPSPGAAASPSPSDFYFFSFFFLSPSRWPTTTVPLLSQLTTNQPPKDSTPPPSLCTQASLLPLTGAKPSAPAILSPHLTRAVPSQPVFPQPQWTPSPSAPPFQQIFPLSCSLLQPPARQTKKRVESFPFTLPSRWSPLHLPQSLHLHQHWSFLQQQPTHDSTHRANSHSHLHPTNPRAAQDIVAWSATWGREKIKKNQTGRKREKRSETDLKREKTRMNQIWEKGNKN